jgi:hypothetical protein
MEPQTHRLLPHDLQIKYLSETDSTLSPEGKLKDKAQRIPSF